MIRLYKLMFWFGLDLNVEAQNWRFLRISAEGSSASRQARFLAAHDLFAVDNLSALRGRSSWRIQGQSSSSKDYPATLRRVVVKDEAGKRITFLSNNFALKPEMIAALYKQRWQVELFFKWIKQHLRIKAFLGTSENAVKTQIWTAVATYVLIAIVKKRLHLPHSLYEILQILSLTMFETTPINQGNRASKFL